MTAAHQQHQIGKRQTVGQTRRQRVARQMVHTQQRQSGRSGNPPRQHHPRQHATDQSRARGDGHRIQLRQRQTRLVQRAFDTMIQPFGMGTGGDFWHDTAKGCV